MNDKEELIARVYQQGQLNGGGLAYSVTSKTPELLNAFLVAYMSLRPEERTNIWNIVREAFIEGEKIGFCKVNEVKR